MVRTGSIQNPLVSGRISTTLEFGFRGGRQIEVERRRRKVEMDSQLSKLGILVAQLESILAASTHNQYPEPLFCFDLLVDLVTSIEQEPRWSLVRCQKKCEEALQALLVLGVAPPVRKLAASATVHLIDKGDHISIYTRTSLLQGWLSDKMDRKSEPPACIGVAQCLGALLQAFGNKLTSGLIETSSIVAKLMRYSEVSVRQAALALLQDALEGSGGGGAAAAYSEALRIITRLGVHDRSALVRTAAAGCLRVFAMLGGPGVGATGLESCCALCLKALEDSAQTVRDAFAAALGALLALGLNPEAQASQPSGKGPPAPPKPIDGGLQKHLINPFVRASGPTYKELRISLTMALVAFLQGMRLNYLQSDLELVEFAMQAIGMLASSPDTHAQACILFCLRVGIIEQMGESTQKQFTDHLIKQISAPDINPAMLVVILRTLSHLLATLGEISETGHDALDNSLVTMLSNSSRVVRVEAALVLRTLAEVDATSANNLLSCGVTTIRALRETVAVEKGDRLRQELDSLHGQAAMLSAILTACPRLALGVPARLPAAVWDVAKAMVTQKKGNPISVGAENEAGWMLIASIVSSMPKEEIEEQKIEFLLLWTREFGEKIEERLKGSESVLLVHLNVWSAAVEALTAFVTNFVVPSMSAMDLAMNEGILLQPLISYLSRALASLSSNALQQASPGLKPAIDLFTIRILRAFQAIPDPVTYQQDHSRLLSLCTAPFIDHASFGASSCLRQLLDSRDASLGPWIPGRDSFEDELRAFEGGADDLSPCIWGYEVSAFPQPLPVTTMLLDEMLLCFGTVFAAQTERKKLQYVQIVIDAGRAGKRQSWHGANMTNTCVALLKALKASIGLRSPGSEVDAMKQLQEILQGILGEDEVSPAQRRAAAEGLGILARLGSDSYAVRLTRSLLTNARGPTPLPLKGSIALALGCVHQSVGGMALSALVPATVQTLCALAKDPSDCFPVWPLHGLWLTADAAGLAYVPHVQATLSLVMELLLSEKHDAPALGQSIGRLINAVVAVLGPELSPGSSLFTRCNAVVAEIGTGGEPAALLECVLFTQQLVLFAPRAVPVHAHVNTLRPTLTSRQPSLRQAAVSTLHHLSEKDAVAMCEARIEQDLFGMLDKETDESIINVVRLTLQRLFEESCPSLPSRWLHLCRNVVLSASTTKTAATAVFEGGPNNSQSDTEGEMFGDDNQGMIMENSPTGLPYGDDEKMKGVDQLPRFKTRVFAAECLRRLPVVVGLDPTHFDLGRAKSLESFGDWLVLHLGELVAVAYQVATGAMEIIRPMGIELLDVILEKFAETRDPMYEGHLLLEQYQAQLVSAARTALDPSASPLLVATGSKLVARIITSGNASGDWALLQRMVNLLTRQLLRWDDIVNPNFAEWVGCKVQVSLLGALACLKTHAKNSLDGKIITSLLTEHATTLGPYWVGLLRDFTALRLYGKNKLPVEYHPFLEGIQIVTIARTVEQYLSEVWLFVLEAVTLDARPTSANVSDKEEDEDESSSSTQGGGIVLSVDDFRQVWVLCMLTLSNNVGNKSLDRRRSAIIGIPSHSSKLVTAAPELIALSSLQCLCLSKGFYTPDMISLELCEELMHIISTPSLLGEASAVLSVVDQIVKSCPPSYVESQDISLRVVELCLYHVFQTLTGNRSVSRPPPEVVDKSLDVISSALGTLGSLVGHFNTEVGDLLLPQLLSAGIKLLNSVSVEGSVASSTLDFMSYLTAAIAKPAKDSTTGDTVDQTMRASLLAAAVESIAQLCINYAGQAKKERDERETIDKASVLRVKNFLKVILDMVCSVPDVNSAAGENFRKGAQACCIDCLHSLLTSWDVQVQLAGLQSLESVVSGGSTKPSVGEGRHLWTIILLREVGADVVQIVYSSIQNPLTTASAAAVTESLKLLILWHSIVKGDEAQQNVLHLLLPAMIGAATAENEDDSLEGATQLRTAALKLVTRLASVPSTAAQFKAVMLELQPESRQQLQTIIKASIQQQQQQQTGKTGPPSPAAPLPLQLPKPLILSTSNGGKSLFPPPKSTTLQPSAGEIQGATTEDDSEDDWDDFQGNTDETSEQPAPPVPEADQKTISEVTEQVNAVTLEDMSSQSQSLPTEGHHDETGDWSSFDSGSTQMVSGKEELKWKAAVDDHNRESTLEVVSHQTSQNTDQRIAHAASSEDPLEWEEAVGDQNRKSAVDFNAHQTPRNTDQDMDPAAASEDPLEWEVAVDDQNRKLSLDVAAHQTPQNTDQDREPASSSEDLSEPSQEKSGGKVVEEAEGVKTVAPGTSIQPSESVDEGEEGRTKGLNMDDVTYSDDLRNVESTHHVGEDCPVALRETDKEKVSLEDAGVVGSDNRTAPTELTDEDAESENRATSIDLSDEEVESENRATVAELRNNDLETESRATTTELSDESVDAEKMTTKAELSGQEVESVNNATATELSNRPQESLQGS